MPKEDNKILKYNHGDNSMKAPFIVHADLECLPRKMRSCPNNLDKSYTEKKPYLKLLVIQCLRIAHFILQKINLIFTEVKTVWKSFLKT